MAVYPVDSDNVLSEAVLPKKELASTFQEIVSQESKDRIYVLESKDGRYLFEAYKHEIGIADRRRNRQEYVKWEDLRDAKPNFWNDRCLTISVSSAKRCYPSWLFSLDFPMESVSQAKQAISTINRLKTNRDSPINIDEPRAEPGESLKNQRVLEPGEQLYFVTIINAERIDIPQGLFAEALFTSSSLIVTVCDTGQTVELANDDILKIEISGPGTVTTNAGLIGGGFGFEGAAWGIAAASLINAITTKSTTNTFLTVATSTGSVTLHTDMYDPEVLQMRLASQIAYAEMRARSGIQNSVGTDIVSKIRELADLKSQGLITEEEYALAKSKLLG